MGREGTEQEQSKQSKARGQSFTASTAPSVAVSTTLTSLSPTYRRADSSPVELAYSTRNTCTLPRSEAEATLCELSQITCEVIRPPCWYVSWDDACAVSFRRWQSQILTVPSSEPDTRNRLSRDTDRLFTACRHEKQARERWQNRRELSTRTRTALCSWRVATSTPFGRHCFGSTGSTRLGSSLMQARSMQHEQ